MTPDEPDELVVVEVRLEADGVVSVALADPAGADLPPWTPGAHLELRLPSGLVRQYSLCGRPEDRSEYRIAVLREAAGRGGSREIHDTGLVGRRLRVTGPRNNFALVPAARHVFVAGGIGITPILAMVRSLDPSSAWSLVYGGRTRSSMAFVDELRAIGGPRVRIVPQDEEGLIDVAGVVGGADGASAIYCCGPAPLLAAVQEAHERLAPSAGLHVERFAASAASPARAGTGPNAPVEVELARTGTVLHVGPDRSVLDALRDVLPDVAFSCTEGYCGSCEVKVLAGTPDHRDEILTDRERASGLTMFPCVSRALSDRLVLDL